MVLSIPKMLPSKVHLSLGSIRATAWAHLQSTALNISADRHSTANVKSGMLRQLIISVRKKNIAHSKVMKLIHKFHPYFNSFCHIRYSQKAAQESSRKDRSRKQRTLPKQFLQSTLQLLQDHTKSQYQKKEIY